MSIGKTAEYVTFVKNTDSSVVTFKATKIRFSADRKSVTVLSWGDNMDSWIGSIDTYYYMYGLTDIKAYRYGFSDSGNGCRFILESGNKSLSPLYSRTSGKEFRDRFNEEWLKR